MMIKLEFIRTISLYITLFLAYLIAITPSGFFRAWVAKKMGDNLPEHYGLLSLNPLDHIDFFGLIFLFLFAFGWGKIVPIDINKLRGKYFNLKLIAVLFADTIMYICIAVFMLFFLSSIPKIHFESVRLFQPASLRDALAGVLWMVMRLSTLLFIVSFFSGIITFIRVHVFDRYPEHRETLFFATFVLLLIFFLLFSGQIDYVFHVMVSWIHTKISSFIGVR